MTFNDFSDTTIAKLASIGAVIFAHIDDTKDRPIFDWYYEVPGVIMSKYLAEKTVAIKNTRKMINVGPAQIEKYLGIKRKSVISNLKGEYTDFLRKIFDVATKIERIVGTKNILTSNKIWEILVGIKLNHEVITEQTRFDAKDKKGNFYEYKIAKSYSFSFEDISENVLNKFLEVKSIILAVVDKDKLAIKDVYEAEPKRVIKRLREKLESLKNRCAQKGKKLRRLQVSLSKGDLELVGATKIA